jgi:hypothetical protein
MSQGFHPQPKLSFMTALPLGVPSLDECMIFSLSENIDPREITARLKLPEGLDLALVDALAKGRPKPRVVSGRWLVRADEPVLAGPPPPHHGPIVVNDPKKGQREFSVSEFVPEAVSLDVEKAVVTIRLGLAGTPKPADVVRFLWKLPPEINLSVLKLNTVLNTDRFGL